MECNFQKNHSLDARGSQEEAVENKQKKTNVALVTLAIFVATFMSAIEGTIVSTAMPTIIGNLNGIAIMNWVFSIYLLTSALMTPIYGKLSDMIGRKPVFIAGLLIFIIGSSLCGLSQSMGQLIAFRAVQGIGAGAIMPVTSTIIADIYPFEKRAKIMGLNGAAWGIAGILGPLLGGFIVDQWSWHWIFYINIPVGLAAVLLVSLFFHEDYTFEKKPVDYLGSFSLMGVLLSILYGIQVVGDTGRLSTESVSWFAAAALCSAVFLFAERRAADPIIPLGLFSSRTFVIQNTAAALVSGFLLGADIYIPMWMQGIKGLKAAMGGFAITPMSLTWMVGSFFASRFLLKHAVKHILAGSLAIIAASALLLGILPIATPFFVFLFITALIGLGMGLTITTTTVTVQNIVPREQIGIATSVNTLFRILGQTVMVSIYGIVLNNKMAQLIAGQKVSGTKITDEMMNQLINPLTAVNLDPTLLPTVRGILYAGIHSIFFYGFLIVLVAMAINAFDKEQKAN
jgi:EmrB/QacA subfamily drug resistance transporter